MDRVKFVDRILIRSFVTIVGQRPLARVNDHPRNIEPAARHFRQIDLIRQFLRVIYSVGEIPRVDIVMRVECDHLGMDLFRLCDQLGFVIARLGVY